MAMSHDDRPDHVKRAFVARLQERAGEVYAKAGSTIASPSSGEVIEREWQAFGVHCSELPADEQGILRISIGGGPHTPIQLNYCTFRGSHADCVDLLRKALKAMERGDDGH